ncbi:hypothetical protein IMZ48_40340 [Candidatus Bathyarchaeota archaeon]|nr:hypothetical protein [Candidatus Bathyarchaeota archaeon]
MFEGYGYHGDFISGWDEQTLGQAVKTCTNPSGRIEDCAVFNIQSQTDASRCDMNVPNLLAHEDVIGPMASLPGGIHMGGFLGDIVDGIPDIVGSGQDPALGGGASSGSPAPSTPDHGVVQKPAPETPVEPPPVQPASAAPAPAAPSTPDNGVVQKPAPETPVEPLPVQPASAAPAPAAPVPEKPASKGPVYEAAVSKEPTPEEPTPAAPVVTQAPEPVAPEEELDIVSTEYVREGNVLSKIVWVEEVLYVTETAYETCTVTVQPAKVKRAHAHMHRHANHYY